jgi:NHL repeat
VSSEAAAFVSSDRSHRRLALAALPLAAAALLLTLFLASAQASTISDPSRPEGVAVDQSSGDFYVAITEAPGIRVDKFDSQGNLLLGFGWGVATGAEELQTCGPQASPPTATCLQSVRGSGAGQFGKPTSVAVEQSTHDVYVTDLANHRVQKFDSEGHFLLAFGGDVVAHGPDNSANNETQKLTVAAESGRFALTFDGAYTGAEGSGRATYGSASLTEVTATSGSFAVGDVISLLRADVPAGTTITAVGANTLTLSHPVQFDTSYGNTQEVRLRADLTPYNATAAQLQSALNSLPTIGGVGGSVSVTGGPGDATGSTPYEITFAGNLAGDDVPQLELDRSGLGPAALGAHLQCSATVGDLNEAVNAETTEYQWLRNGAPIPAATASTYTAVAADEGKALQCQVTAKNSNDGSTAVVAAVQQIAPAPATAPPAPHAGLKIKDAKGLDDAPSPSVGAPGGQILVCRGKEADWTGAPTFSYQWYRNGAPLSGNGADTAEYTLQAADLTTTATFQCAATAVDAGGAFTMVSQPLPTSPAPSPPAPQFINVAIGISTPHQGGAPEVCKAADVCKTADTGAANGQFMPWPEQDGLAAGLLAVQGATVYVADRGRVQEFSSSGAYTGQIALPHPTDVPTAIAVNSAGDLYVIAEGLSNGVHEFKPSGEEITGPKLPLDASGNPQALAINAADEVYVRDYDSARNATQVLAYDENAVQTDLVRAGEVTGGPGGQHGGLALGQSARKLYLPDTSASDVVIVDLPPPGPGVEAESVSELLATRATAHAILNPKSHSTTFHFQYVTKHDFETEGGFSSPHTLETAESAPIGSNFEFKDVEQLLPGLQAETAYRYRVVATNTKGTVDGPGAAFTTYPPALFSPQAPTGLQPTALTLHLDLNPEGLDTHYRFQYVTQAHFEAEGFANSESTPELDAGEAATFTPLQASLTNLTPNTAYRFRAVASNSASAGPLASTDFPFETPPTVCPNQARREDEHSLALPQCRAYEQVSPADKLGSPARQIGAAPSGQRVVFNSLGIFAGEPTEAGNYLSRRTPQGWLTEGIDPPPSLGSTDANGNPNEDLTEFLFGFVAIGHTEASAGTPIESGASLLRGPDGAFSQASPLLHRPEGGEIASLLLSSEPAVSADLSHVFFESSTPLLATDPYPVQSNTTHQRIYEVANAGTPAAALRLASVDSAGHVYQGCDPVGSALAESTGGLGSGSSGALSLPQHFSHSEQVSRDGSIVFFSTWSPALPEGVCAVLAARQLLARVNGTETVDLSQPQPSQCGSGPAPDEVSCRNAPVDAAAFAGASANGKKAFFVSRRQLTDDATEEPANVGGSCNRPTPPRTGCNLYMYDFERPPGERLTAVSAGDTSGLGPGVTGFLDVSLDGSHVYFTAAGLLTEKRNALGQQARPGAENIYVYDTETGRTSFVADLCTGAGASGSAHGLTSCPGSGNDEPNGGLPMPNELTPDGRYLVFSTYAQLTPDDENQARDVYRYDASTESLLRISVGHEGQDQNGNGGGQDAEVSTDLELLRVPHRVLSADGQTIVFHTARPLQEGDENGKVDAYLWHQGQVDLLSGGHVNINGGKDVTLSASGKDVFFSTVEGLVPTDVDGLGDVYDARIGGGFPLPQPPPPICESPEGCGRHAGPEPPPPVLGSESLKHEPEEPEKPCKKGFVKKHGHCVKVRKHHKKHHHVRSHKRAASPNRGGGK